MPCFGAMKAHSVQFAPQAWQLVGGCEMKLGATGVMSLAPCCCASFLVGVGNTTEVLWEEVAGCKSESLPSAAPLE